MQKADIRILVVDDDADIRRNITKTLQRVGYKVDPAENCQNAIKNLQTESYHLVVTDLHMPDFDGRFSPRAGLNLLKRINQDFPECFVIMLSGAGEIRHALEVRDYGITYVEKNSGNTQEFLDIISQTIQINLDLKINYGYGTNLKSAQDEEILRRLYVNASEINVSLIAPGTRGTVVYRVTARDLDGKWRVAQATKIAWKDQIQLEEKNYHKWVDGRIQGDRYAHLMTHPVYTRKRGGMLMRFLNLELDGLLTFYNFYQNQNVDAVSQVINNLFDNTLAFWHEDKDREVLLLIQAYVQYFDVDNWQLDKHMSRYLKEFAGQAEIRFEEIDLHFPNPITLFQQLLNSPYDFEKRTYKTIVHGDLHSDNIMVDKFLNCWLLDFTRTGPAHILRDFIELETSIKFSALESKPLVDICKFEAALESQDSLTESIPNVCKGDTELQKALAAIQLIRQKAAYAILPEKDIREYYIGLLFHTMINLRFLGKQSTSTKRKLILYSSWLILDKLQQLGFQF